MRRRADCIVGYAGISGNPSSCDDPPSILRGANGQDGTEGERDPGLATALRKYEEDTCEAIKQYCRKQRSAGAHRLRTRGNSNLFH